MKSDIGGCSWFGGPDDSGIGWNEGLALFPWRDGANRVTTESVTLFLPGVQVGDAALARLLNPKAYYGAFRIGLGRRGWPLLSISSGRERELWFLACVLVRAVDTGEVVAVRAVDIGPAVTYKGKRLNRVGDYSPATLERMGVRTGAQVQNLFLGSYEDWPILPTPEEAKLLWEEHETRRCAFLAVARALRDNNKREGGASGHD